MRILCPQCHNSIDTAALSSSVEIVCPACGSSFQPAGKSTIDLSARGGHEKLGRFELLELLGEGAFGTVYKARDPKLDRVVAVKVPRDGGLTKGPNLNRFLREARSAAQLQHPAIVAVHEAGAADGVPYLVTDFVEGVTLGDWLSAHPPTPKKAAALIAALADALAYAHDKGVVHRDVKPSNIMVCGDGSVQLMDFGLAKREAGEQTLTQDGKLLGTPAYMSPEQARGEGHQADGRSDVYSLGVILYLMLTGKLPFRGNARIMVHQVLHDDPPPPRRLNSAVPRDAETICLKALAKEPHRRYQTAQEMAADLRRFVKGEPIEARPVGSAERLQRWCMRNPMVASLLALVCLAISGGAAAGTYFALQARAKEGEVARGQEELVQSRQAVVRTHEALEETARDARFDTYSRLLTKADLAWSDNQPEQAQALLQQCPEEYRQWEWHLLRQLQQGALRVLGGNSGAVGHLAYSPDGRWMASSTGIANASPKKDTKLLPPRPQVKIWDAATGKNLTTLKGVNSFVRELAFLPSSDRLVGCSSLVEKPNSFVVLQTWSVSTGEVVNTVKLKSVPVRALPAAVTAKMFSESKAKLKEVLVVSEVVRTALSADGTQLAIAQSLRKQPAEAYQVQIWDTQTGESKLPPKELAGSVRNLAFSRSGQELAATTYQPIKDQNGKFTKGKYTVSVWGTGNRENTAAFSLPGSTVGGGLAFSPDNRRLAFAWNETDPQSRKLLGVVRVCELPSGKEAFTVNVKTGWISGGLVFSPDGRYLACGDPGVRQKVAGTVNVWDAQTGHEVATHRGHTAEIMDVVFSPDSRRLVSGAADQTIRTWNAAREVGLLNLNGQAVALSPDRKDIATARTEPDPESKTPNLFVTFSDPASGQPRLTVKCEAPGTVARMAYDADGQQLAAVFIHTNQEETKYSAVVKVWDVATGREEATFPLEGLSLNKLVKYGTGPTIPLAFSRNGRRLAIVGDEAKTDNPASRMVAVWDLTTRRRVFTSSVAVGDILGLAFTPDGKRLAIGGGLGWDSPMDSSPSQSPSGQVVLLDANKGNELLTFQAQAIGINALDFSPNSEQLATAARDGEIKLWDTSNGKAVRTFNDPSQRIWSLAFSPDGKRLATASADHTIKLWDPDKGRLVFSLRGHLTGISHLSFDTAGQRLASVGVNGVIKVWDAGVRP